MSHFFADAAVQKTTGKRGKSTGRRSTRTVAGCDGAYCADMKEELIARDPWTAYQVTVEVTYTESGIVNQCELFRERSVEAAKMRLVDYIDRNARFAQRAVKHLYRVHEVKVRWELVGRDVKEVVFETKTIPVLLV